MLSHSVRHSVGLERSRWEMFVSALVTHEGIGITLRELRDELVVEPRIRESVLREKRFTHRDTHRDGMLPLLYTIYVVVRRLSID